MLFSAISALFSFYNNQKLKKKKKENYNKKNPKIFSPQFHNQYSLEDLSGGFRDELFSDLVCQFHIFSEQENKCIILAYAIMF